MRIDPIEVLYLESFKLLLEFLIQLLISSTVGDY